MAGEKFGNLLNKLGLGANANSAELDRILLSLIASNGGIASSEDSTTSGDSGNGKWEDVDVALSTKTYAQRGLQIPCNIDPAGDYMPPIVAAVASDEVAVPSSPPSPIPTPEDLLKQGSIITEPRILKAVKDIQVGNEVLVINTWILNYKFGEAEPFGSSNLAPSEVKKQFKIEFKRLDAARGHQPSSVDVGWVPSFVLRLGQSEATCGLSLESRIEVSLAARSLPVANDNREAHDEGSSSSSTSM